MKTNIIKEELKELMSHSEKCEAKQKEFLNNKKMLNKKTGEIEDLNYDLKKEYQLKYNDLIFKSIYFQKKMEEKYQDKYTALFITLTANTQYHQYKLDENKNLINNPRYKKGYTPNNAYELLNNVKRKFVNEFSKSDFGRTKIPYLYCQVVEKHISLTPHLHIVLFVPTEHLETVINIIKRKMKLTDEKRVIVNDKNKPINKYLINSNYIKNKHNDVGRCEIEILQDAKKVTGYVSKYIKKQFKSDNIDYIHELDGWKRKNGITLVLTSRTPVPKYIYKSIFSKLENIEKEKFQDLFCDIQNNTTLKKTDIKTCKSKTKRAFKKEIFKADVTTSTKTITKKELEIQKKLCEAERKLPTKKEVNINQTNQTIFDIFMSNIDIKKLKKDLIVETFNIKHKHFYNDIYLHEDLASKYHKWLNKLLKHIEHNNKKLIKITKIERLILKYYDVVVIYDSDDWELIEYSNEKIA